MVYSYTRRPAEPFQGLRRLNSLLDEAFGTWPVGPAAASPSAWIPPVDVTEAKDTVTLVAELPGVAPTDVAITLENNLLTIRGEKKQAVDAGTERVQRLERRCGAFERSFRVPGTVDPDRISARFEHGLLTVTLPKAEKAKPRQIEIRAN